MHGSTRSSIQRNHALITPESHVQSPLPGWIKSKGVIVIAPALGARFTQYFALMESGATAGAPPAQVQRFFYLLEGAVTLRSAGQNHKLAPGGYAYLPAGAEHELESEEASRLLFFEKTYSPLAGVGAPDCFIGHETEVEAAPFLGDPDALLKYLLPPTPGADMEINLFTFNPGAALPLVEVHLMEHGLLFLQGGGIYRLGDRWYPVQAGDVIWMAPFCPQWFGALGKTPARYLYYKDVNRDPMGGAA